MNSFPICIGRKDGRSKLNIFMNAVLIIALVCLVAEVLFFARFARVYVVGDSMSPTLTGAQYKNVSGGDFVYVDKYSTPEPGDIIVIDADNKIIIKRLIALGGDSVELKSGKLYINDELVSEPYVFAENNLNVFKNTYERTVVPEGCMFFLGDNRDVSNDSRSEDYGMMSVSAVIGVVADWSLNLKGFFTPINTFFEFTLPSLFGL